MATFEEIRQRAAEVAEIIADKSVKFARLAADKTKLAGKIVKLAAEVNYEKDTLRKTSANLGMMYYEKYRDNPEPDFAQCCADITATNERIEEKREMIRELRRQMGEGLSPEETAEEEATIEDILNEVDATMKAQAAQGAYEQPTPERAGYEQPTPEQAPEENTAEPEENAPNSWDQHYD